MRGEAGKTAIRAWLTVLLVTACLGVIGCDPTLSYLDNAVPPTPSLTPAAIVLGAAARNPPGASQLDGGVTLDGGQP